MGKRIICGCVVLGIVACLIGCQKSDNYELMKESKQQVLPIVIDNNIIVIKSVVFILRFTITFLLSHSEVFSIFKQ